MTCRRALPYTVRHRPGRPSRITPRRRNTTCPNRRFATSKSQSQRQACKWRHRRPTAQPQTAQTQGCPATRSCPCQTTSQVTQTNSQPCRQATCNERFATRDRIPPLAKPFWLLGEVTKLPRLVAAVTGRPDTVETTMSDNSLTELCQCPRCRQMRADKQAADSQPEQCQCSRCRQMCAASQAAQQAETEGQIASVEGQAARATEENPAAEQAVERSSRRRVTPTVEQTASEPLQHQQDVDQTDTSERTVAKTDTAAHRGGESETRARHAAGRGPSRSASRAAPADPVDGRDLLPAERHGRRGQRPIGRRHGQTE